MAKKKKSEERKISEARKMINPDFMVMDEKEMDEFDDQIDQLIKNADRDLKKAEWQKNDTYIKNDIFEQKDGEDE